MTRKVMQDGVLRDETPEEKAQTDLDLTNHQARKEADDNARQEHQNLKASAKAKLMSGEALTEEEANTIVL